MNNINANLNKKMTVKDFIDKYDRLASDKAKEEFIKSVICKRYLNYEDKIAMCTNIINCSCYVTINDKKKFKQNTPAKYMLHRLSIIDKYTGISIDFSAAADVFNTLEKKNMIDLIMCYIPENELRKIDAIMQMVTEDIYENERSLISYIDTKFEEMSLLGSSLLEGLGDVVKAENIIDFLSQK